MGIKDLSKVIADNAPNAIKLNEMKSYFGRKVAIDASMCLYQFLIAVRQDGSQLQSESGETTSHLMGMFYRTIRMIDNGVKPCYVFDGKPPDMKSGELEKRSEKRAEAEKALTEAKERGDTEAVDKFERRLVKVTKEQNADVKRLLGLMGVPVIEAPCEAEAQCAALVKAKKVYGTATEDMDALTFGSDVLLRHMTFSEAKKMPIKEFSLSRILTDFDMTKEQFIDLCILLGCDYCESIRGVGPKKAFDLIKTYGDIETILENIDHKKYPPPENWPYKRARELFLNPEVADCENMNLVWKEPDVDGIMKFMCEEKNFNEERVKSAIAKMQKGRSTATQGRIDAFFSVNKTVKSEPTSAKRKAEEEKKATKKRGPPLKKPK
ncbi:putative flap structure-specific endonuclease [Ancylostoma caninum]|uniref:Flap endonuclease 1 n=1 Tax=Ancylostoma caninum TaxID=29170 RepID=A0A368GNI9_ANCCA|nr:putative flap structure-specific endonuclease [Ancylostoma caninum]